MSKRLAPSIAPNSKKYILAVDAGGTKCHATLYDDVGNKLIEKIAGPANLTTDFQGAVSQIADLSRKLCTLMNLSSKDVKLSIAAAGGGSTSIQKKVKELEWNFSHLSLHTDIHAATIASNHKNDCICLSIGTGSSIGVLHEGNFVQLGGRGFILGDVGSGAWLIKNVVSWYLHRLDVFKFKSRDENIPTENLCEQLWGDDPRSIVMKFHQASPAMFAQYAPEFLAIASDCEYLQSLLKQATDYLLSLVYSLPLKLRVFVCGGLSTIYTPLLQNASVREINLAPVDLTYGAFLLANE